MRMSMNEYDKCTNNNMDQQYIAKSLTNNIILLF